MTMRIGFGGDAPDGSKDVGAARFRTRVHHEDAFVARLHDDVRACADEHVHVALDVQRLDGAVRRV